MDEKFLFGALIGMMGGALIVANSVKARKFVVNGQEEVGKKVEKVLKTSGKKAKA